MKWIFTDVDGSKYYQTKTGDIVNRNGQLVSITCEDNIRMILSGLDLKHKRETSSMLAPTANEKQTD